MKKFSWSLGVALLATSCATSISGRLQTPDGQAVSHEDARVNVMRLDHVDKTATGGSMILSVDGSGKFATETSLPDGNYLIEALVPGFKITSTRVDLKGSSVVDLTVSPLTEVKTQAIGTNMNVDMSRGSGGATLTPPTL